MRARILGAFSILTAIGCSSGNGGPPPRTITPADITPIPPGTALGSLFSGDYVLTGGSIEGCSCRIGNCGLVHVGVGNVLTIVETDGALQMTVSSNTITCAGGINSDGSYLCNSQLVQPGNVQYVVDHGQIYVANGQPVSLTDTDEASVVLPTLDCDFRATMTAQYAGPPSSFAAANAPAAAMGFSLLGP